MYVGKSRSNGWRMNIPKMSTDHVGVWFDPWYWEHILERIRRKIGNDEFVANLILTFKFSEKECGVCPIYVSDYKDFKRTMELESNKKRPRDDDDLELQQQLLPHFKKLKLDLETQTNINNACTCEDVDELESLLMRISIT